MLPPKLILLGKCFVLCRLLSQCVVIVCHAQTKHITSKIDLSQIHKSWLTKELLPCNHFQLSQQLAPHFAKASMDPDNVRHLLSHGLTLITAAVQRLTLNWLVGTIAQYGLTSNEPNAPVCKLFSSPHLHS